ncbi:hypothetical protein BS78_10G035200 [Paspalum vaginatum]|nr:hypothetical protein BS78_10G035200 [Paspalum vaginatum]
MWPLSCVRIPRPLRSPPSRVENVPPGRVAGSFAYLLPHWSEGLSTSPQRNSSYFWASEMDLPRRGSIFEPTHSGSPSFSAFSLPMSSHCRPNVLSSFEEDKFTFAELEAATEGFSPDVKIGEGSFGTVYRGNGREEVAIKRCFQGCSSRLELAFLSGLRHNNLVELAGYCEENKEVLLVYEYMESGALYDHLHSAATKQAETPLTSSWKLRIMMLLDASRGIEYLHTCLLNTRSPRQHQVVQHPAPPGRRQRLDGARVGFRARGSESFCSVTTRGRRRLPGREQHRDFWIERRG